MTPFEGRQTRLRRSKRGDTVHRAGCSRAVNTVPWIWAEDHTDAEVLADPVVKTWIRPCKICDPFAESLCVAAASVPAPAAAASTLNDKEN